MLDAGRMRAFRVEGESMNPTLCDGDAVLVEPRATLGIGDIVAAEHPYKRVKIIKRVQSIDDNGRLVLKGDNPEESTDSRLFGSIPSSEILGKVICRFKA